MFISFEGIDGCGKSTQFMKLAQHVFKLNKHNHVTLTRNPYKNVNIRGILREDNDPLSQSERLADLFIGDRKKQAEEIIVPNLSKGNWVITDRYKLSTIAYQGAQGMDMKKLLEKHEGLPIPSITFVIDVPAKVAFERMSGDIGRAAPHKLEADINFLESVRQNYLKMKEFIPYENIIVVDGTKSVDAVFEDICKALDVELNKTG